MATYATASDIDLPESTLVYLTTEPNAGANWPDDVVIEDKLVEADAEIDAHIRARYALPLAYVDPILKRIAVALVRCALYARRPDGPPVPELISAACTEARRSLRDIRDGRIDLAGAEDQSAAGESGKVAVSSNDRVFTVTELDKMP